MLVKERHQRILSMLDSHRAVSANDLAQFLSVSRETVRRDLLDLENSGLANRVHGGAMLPNKSNEEPFDNRKVNQQRAKHEIARKAVSLVPVGASIMVDAGTTTTAFGQALATLSGIMVVTNSIEIAQIIKLSESDIDLILIGGQMLSDVPATYGELTISELRRFNFDMAFISPVALHPEKGAFSFALQEAEVAQTMIAQTKENVILCDRTKLGKTNRVRFIESTEINHLVTDNLAKEHQLEPFIQSGIKVIK